LPETIAASPRVDPVPALVPPVAERSDEAAAPATAPSASQGAKPEKHAIDTSLAAERRLIDAARAALVAGNSASGLERLVRHAAQYPRGALAEERSALMVDALVAAGHYDEAKRRADAFRARYPGSLFAPSVDAALRAIP
jgi:outer membrane protein assembly factor BamD (BamD/ComL family)